MKKRLIVAGGSVALLLSVMGWLWRPRPILPSSLKSQISFVVLYPSDKGPAKTDRTSINYNSSDKILTYKAKLGETNLIITNQATPEAFTDIPQAYDKVIAGMHSYASLDSASGKVYLTKPENVGQQVAVVSTKGTLMFVRADHDLSEDQWRKFFNNLSELK